ncbi:MULTISPECIES: MaoC family dehydratase [Hyphobacterium]|uniref:MaoC family dehydratase n=1 Tax=Hyphobacterium vulgare TaxID=1736751 RepID=A0ABV7A099_9PROT
MTDLTEFRSQVGKNFTSDWMQIDQDRVNAFADITIDHNFIHIDAERTKRETPFSGTIAHGFLSLSMLSYFGAQCLPVFPAGFVPVNYGFESVRFAAPVPVGTRIRGVFTFKSLEERKPGQFLLTFDVRVEIENSTRPALRAEWLSMMLAQA